MLVIKDQITEEKLLKFYNKLVPLALSFVYRNFLDNTLPDIYFNTQSAESIQGPKSLGELREIFFDSQVFKGLNSSMQKLNKLQGSIWQDYFRFTQIIPGKVTMESIILEMKTVAEFVGVDGWKLCTIKPKIEDTRYSDITLIFVKMIDYELIYLEVQINSQANLDAKKEESSKYSERKAILEQILTNNQDCKLSIKKFKAKLNRHFLSSDSLENFLLQNNLRQGAEELFISYQNSFFESRAIYEGTSPIINSTKSGQIIVARFKKENPNLVTNL